MFNLNIFSSPLFRQYAVVIVANLTILTTGLGLAWPSPVLVKLTNANHSALYRPITSEEGSWIVSIGFLTGICANFIGAFLVDQIGRKYCICLASLPKLVACIIFVFANEVWMLLVARSLVGITDGFVFNIVPMYASEIATKEIRGSLGTILQIMCSMGIVTMLCMGPFIPYLTLNIIYFSAVFVTSVPLLFLPESPYFLFAKGRNEQARKVLTFLRGSEQLASEELKEYSLAKTDEKIDKKELLKNKAFLKAFGIMLILGLMSQLVGFNAVTFYLQTVLQSTNTSVEPEIASVVIGCIQLIAAFCTTLVTDRFGRKPILCTTLVGMSIGMLGLGTFFKLREIDYEISGFLNFVPLISLILVVYCYSAGMGSVIWPLSAELFDGPSRAVGLSISSVVSTIFIFITTKYFASVTSAIGPSATYWVFSVNCIICCLFIIFCVPETKGKTFAEIQETLEGKKKGCDV